MPSPPSIASSLWATMSGDFLPAERVDAGVGGINILAHQEVNTIDSAVHSSTIAGGGTVSLPNQIGVAFVGETGTYVAGTASYSFVGGSYDSICNQIAGVAIGPHHRLHASGNHGACIGGSTLEVKAGSYNICIGGGGASQGNAISGGGNNGVIAGGLNHALSSAGNGNAIIGGNGVTLSSSGSYNAAIAAQSCTISGSAQNAAVFGTTHTVAQSYGLTFGSNQVPVAPASLTFGGKALVAAGDCQAVSFAAGIVTTNATVGTLTITGSNLQFNNSKTSAFVGKFFILGIDTATKNMCAFQGEIFGYWDGTNLFMDDASGAATGPATTGERSLTAMGDGITVGGVTIALTAGQLRFKATGKAATNIQWVARADIAMTYF